VRQGAGGKGEQVEEPLIMMDAPLWIHLPKLLLWSGPSLARIPPALEVLVLNSREWLPLRSGQLNSRSGKRFG
jgi:hypothetical protein